MLTKPQWCPITYARPNQESGQKSKGLLTVMQVSLTVHLLTLAMAQPTATVPASNLPPLSPDNRASSSKTIGMVRLAEQATLPVHLKVTDATLEDVTVQLKQALGLKIPIEIRLTSAAHFTFGVQATPVGQILNSVATLAGGKLYVLSDRLLMAQANQLSATESQEAKEWHRVFNDRGAGVDSVDQFVGQARQVILDNIITWFQTVGQDKEQPGKAAPQTINATQVRLGDLNPDLHQMVQYVVTWNNRRRDPMAAPLTSDTVISFDNSAPGSYRLEIKSQSQGQHYVIDIRRK